MKFMRNIIFLILGVIIFLVILTFIPETASHLEKNFQKNVIRSFENSKMQTQLDDHEFSFWPLFIKWRFLNIARHSNLHLPNSLLNIFQSIIFSNCILSINPGWFKLNAELQCNKIDVSHLPLRWFYVSNLNSSISKDFYFVHSDFRNLEDKQGWLGITVKADNLIINGKTMRSLHLNYYFSSRKELVIEWPKLKEKILLVNEPEQLKVVHLGMKENFGFLSQNLYPEIKSLWQKSL